jgi:hypothetical protein
MKRIFISVFFLFPVIILFAQNMVPNGGFECGDDICIPTQVYADFSHIACDWFSANTGTPDVFYHRDGIQNCWTAMPQPLGGSYNGTPYIGSQLPRTGSRFAGILSFFNNAYNYREYIQDLLESPLRVGQKYCGEFYVSSASHARYAINNMGMYLHTTKQFHDSYSYLPRTPQISVKEILQDTLKWTKVAGIIIADSAYQYVTIGNFFPDSETKHVEQPSWGSDDWRYEDIAYYFIDDVSVLPFTEKTFSFAGNPVVCQGKAVSLQALGGLEDIEWTTLQDTVTVIASGENLSLTPEQTTTYRVKGKNCHIFLNDTITIKVEPSPVLSLGDDRTICKGDSLILNAYSSFKTYLWQDGSSSPIRSVTQEGMYSLKVSNEFNCYSQDDVQVNVLDAPRADLGADRFYCNNLLPIAATDGFRQEYVWSTGATDSVITPANSGSYSVQITNQCGQSSDTVQVFSLHDLFIPNVVTLNDDDYNSKFKVGIRLGPDKLLNTNVDLDGKMKIINQWGNEIFNDPHYMNTWPRQSEDLEGTYYYGFNFGSCPIVKGWVQVIK